MRNSWLLFHTYYWEISWHGVRWKLTVRMPLHKWGYKMAKGQCKIYKPEYIFRKSHVIKLIKSLTNCIYQRVSSMYVSNPYHVKKLGNNIYQWITAIRACTVVGGLKSIFGHFPHLFHFIIFHFYKRLTRKSPPLLLRI